MGGKSGGTFGDALALIWFCSTPIHYKSFKINDLHTEELKIPSLLLNFEHFRNCLSLHFKIY